MSPDIILSVCKFNVNTELREAGLQATDRFLKTFTQRELVDLMTAVIDAMQVPIMAKIQRFGSSKKTG